MCCKTIDDVLWFHRVGDVAFVDKVRHVGPPPANSPNPTAQGAGNPLKFYSYVFIPKHIDRSKKYPLLVFPHGGVHSNFSTYHTHIIRELMFQGYIVIASEYRGSTGYGRGMYENIDYGGLETEDVYAGRNYMIENYDFVDKDRVGILGWSHGGLITLFNIFDHPKDYKVAYAGVPVSDLIARKCRGIPQAFPGLACGETPDAAAHPHQHQRCGRECVGGGASHQIAEGRR